jgi:hypothetical protein
MKLPDQRMLGVKRARIIVQATDGRQTVQQP